MAKGLYTVFGYALIVNTHRLVKDCEVIIQEPNSHSFLVAQALPLTCSIRLI